MILQSCSHVDAANLAKLLGCLILNPGGAKITPDEVMEEIISLQSAACKECSVSVLVGDDSNGQNILQLSFQCHNAAFSFQAATDRYSAAAAFTAACWAAFNSNFELQIGTDTKPVWQWTTHLHAAALMATFRRPKRKNPATC